MKHAFLYRFTALVLAISIISAFAAGCGAKPEEPTVPSHALQTVPATQPHSLSPSETTVPGHTTIPTETSVPTTAPAETQVPTEESPEDAGDSGWEDAPVGSSRFYIRVNCQTNTVTIYEQDETGAYTVPYKAMVCSSGLDTNPTPTGIYYPTGNRWYWLEMVGGVWGMYVTQIIGDYLFHSVPYLEWDNHGSLQPGEFDKLGQDASHGCIRLQVKDAKWIFENMWDIEAIELFNSPDPGPLGKPWAPIIGDSAYPGWDPSDPIDGNPWHDAPAPTEAPVPGPAVPETTVPETTVHETTVPETTVPETTVPETAVPETAVPETAVPGTSVPKAGES